MDDQQNKKGLPGLLVVCIVIFLIFILVVMAFASGVKRNFDNVGENVGNASLASSSGGAAGNLMNCKSIPADWRDPISRAASDSGGSAALIAAIISGGEHESWHRHNAWPRYQERYDYGSEPNPAIHDQDKEGYVRGPAQFKENTFAAYSPDALRNGTPSRFGTVFKVEPYIEQTYPSLVAAGAYLAANGGKDGASEDALKRAIERYNRSQEYINRVLRVYNEYVSCMQVATGAVVYNGQKACPVATGSAGWGPVTHSNPHVPTYPGHEGLDVFANRGTPIFSVTSGTVIKAGYSGGYRVMIDDGQGHFWFYQHMLPNLEVKKGQRVQPGDRLGYMSNSGAEQSAVHLHLGIAKVSNPITGGVGSMRWDMWYYPYDFVRDIPCLAQNIKD